MPPRRHRKGGNDSGDDSVEILEPTPSIRPPVPWSKPNDPKHNVNRMVNLLC